MWGWWREEIKQKGKRTHGHGQQGGDCGGEGLQGEDMVMEQNTIKIKLKKNAKHQNTVRRIRGLVIGKKIWNHNNRSRIQMSEHSYWERGSAVGDADAEIN